jgi:hypothetical protein
MSEQQQRTAPQSNKKRSQFKRSAAFASTTFVTMGLVDLFGHMGPTGLLIAGLASYAAWNHGPELLESIQGQVRELLPPSDDQEDNEQTSMSGEEQPRRRSFWERALNAPFSEDELEAMEDTFSADDNDPEVFISEGITFRELLELGVIQKAIAQGKMVLGFANGELRYGTWQDFNSAGAGGVSGSGKTTTIRFLLFQTVLLKGRFIMIDPHIEDQEESLAAQFRVFKHSHVFPPCDDNASAVTKRVRWMMKEYLRRKELGIKGPPIILVLDELNALLRRLSPELRKELTDLLLTLAQEGRKFGLFALLIAQRWSEQDLGGKPWGAAIRSSLASMLAHRFIDEEQAKKLIGTKNGPRCLELEQGHYLFRDTQGRLTEMVTPFTCEEDSLLVLRLLGKLESVEAAVHLPIAKPQRIVTEEAGPMPLPERVHHSSVVRSPYYPQTATSIPTSVDASVATSSATSAPTSMKHAVIYPVKWASEADRSGIEVGEEAEVADEVAKVQLTEREQQIIKMFLDEGLNPSQIAKKLSGANGGTEYTKASVEVAETLRKAMRG